MLEKIVFYWWQLGWRGLSFLSMITRQKCEPLPLIKSLGGTGEGQGPHSSYTAACPFPVLQASTPWLHHPLFGLINSLSVINNYSLICAGTMRSGFKYLTFSSSNMCPLPSIPSPSLNHSTASWTFRGRIIAPLPHLTGTGKDQTHKPYVKQSQHSWTVTPVNREQWLESFCSLSF